MSLYDIVKNYTNSNAIRFHMPSHNGVDIGVDTSYDITELSFSDNLLKPTSVLLELERTVAKAYNANYSILSTTGATTVIAMALYTVREYGENLLIVGDAHKSVYNYAKIFGYKITTISCIENITRDTKYNVVLYTSPNYYGNLTKIEKIKGAITIVDQSHGSHFIMSDKLPKNDINADILVLSFHKTLAVLTGGAAGIVNNKELYEKMQNARQTLHSTSPNYMILSSIDKVFGNLANLTRKYDIVLDYIEDFSHRIPSPFFVTYSNDKTRLVISSNNLDMLYIKQLLENENIYVEMATSSLIVLIVTPYNYIYLEDLLNSLEKISKRELKIRDIHPIPKIEKKINVDINQKCELISIENAKNRVCMSNVGIYPPGVPILTFGDIIEYEMIDYLKNCSEEIFGLVNGKICVLKEKI